MTPTQTNFFSQSNGAGKVFSQVQLVLHHYGATDHVVEVFVPDSVDAREDLAATFERAAWLVRHAPPAALSAEVAIKDGAGA